MSLTRNLVDRVREGFRPGAGEQLTPPGPAAPPAAIQTATGGSSDFARQAARHTTALVGINHAGTRYHTRVVLQFQAELAVAHEAVETQLPEGWAEANGMLPLHSRVTNHREYLLRPDLGRRLDDASLERLRQHAAKDVDVQPILADGLSAVACLGAGRELLAAFTRECQARGWRVGTPMCARFARVWLQDEIGQEVRAKVAAILLGERPGLGTGDGLSAYMIYEPRLGKADNDRNMMSNIHERGTPPPEAAARLAMLAGAMMEQKTSGVTLNLRGLDNLGDAGGTGYRDPQPRVNLVEVPR